MSKKSNSFNKQSIKTNDRKANGMPAIDAACEAANLLNDKRVKEDRVVRLAMLSILGLYCQGVPTDEIDRLEIMNGTFFINVLDNYRPGLGQQLSPSDLNIMMEEFCNGLKSMVKALFLACLKFDGKHATIDTDKIIKLRDSLQEMTWVHTMQ